MGALESPPPIPVADAALEALYRQHQRMILRTAYRLTRSMNDAEDVLHGLFVRLLQRQVRLSPGAEPGPYLHRAAVNLALDVLRRRHRILPLEALPPENEASEPRQLRLVDSSEIGERLRAGLASLPGRQAEVFVLRHVEGYSNQEIGRMLGISWGTVAVTLHRARRRLQQLLGSGRRA